MNWDAEILNDLQIDRYEAIIAFYEKKVNDGNCVIEDYWYLGLAYLLYADETTAQLVWSIAFSQIDELEIPLNTLTLIEVLNQEAIRQVQTGNSELSHLIRHHIFIIFPDFIDNILELILLKISSGKYNPQVLNEVEISEKLRRQQASDINEDILVRTIVKTLRFPASETIIFLQSAIQLISSRQEFVSLIQPILKEYTYQKRVLFYSEAIASTCLDIIPNNHYVLKTLHYIKSELKNFQDALEIAEILYNEAIEPIKKIQASALLLLTAMQAANWDKVAEFLTLHKQNLSKFNDNQCQFNALEAQTLLTQASLFLYCQDNLSQNRSYHNTAAKLLEERVSPLIPQTSSTSLQQRTSATDRKVKVGYIAHTWRSHSVGWLSRWLFQHHNRKKFEIYIYFVNKNQSQQNCNNPFFQTWFAPHIDEARELGNNPVEIADTIQNDNIDILVDLDSTTLGLTCHVMALKPAPIQITWLGRDATGLSTVDYFIADPYVLPNDADKYYQEAIWRLPNTYIAVEGFEIGVPTLKRTHLNIPNDAVIYLSAQTGMKRHPDLLRLQMKIIKQVPNSYFLIKGIADQDTIQSLVKGIASEEGVDPSRIKFLARDLDELTHRANLQVADIVLDTYPYNGATTTLETLWMGVPMVTRVGDQFAARNSYTFLKNVGITEGIAFSDDEYIDWGVTLGTDSSLRQKVASQLKQSRQSSPLWDTQTFTKEMENGYLEMINRHSISPKT